MFVKSAVAVTLLASFVAAQTNLTFDPATVDLTIRSLFSLFLTVRKNASNIPGQINGARPSSTPARPSVARKPTRTAATRYDLGSFWAFK
jgi:hypothetical protein